PDTTNYIVTALSSSATDHFLQGAIDDYKHRLFGRVIERIANLFKEIKSAPSPTIDQLFMLISNHDLSETGRYIRREAASALGQIGKKELTVLDKLLATLTDPDEEASASAARGLEQLDNGL